MIIPEATVLFPTLPVFSDIHAIFKGCVYGHAERITTARYFRNLFESGPRLRSQIQPRSCHPAVIE